MKKPYLVKITTSMSTVVVIWAETRCGALNAAYDIDTSNLEEVPDDTEAIVLGEASSEEIYENDSFNEEGEEIEPLFCEECGRMLTEGYTDADGSLHVCPDCFEEYMNKHYGTHGWMEVPDDGCDGYYLVACASAVNGYTGTGIFYTTWED